MYAAAAAARALLTRSPSTSCSPRTVKWCSALQTLYFGCQNTSIQVSNIHCSMSSTSSLMLTSLILHSGSRSRRFLQRQAAAATPPRCQSSDRTSSSTQVHAAVVAVKRALVKVELQRREVVEHLELKRLLCLEVRCDEAWSALVQVQMCLPSIEQPALARQALVLPTQPFTSKRHPYVRYKYPRVTWSHQRTAATCMRSNYSLAHRAPQVCLSLRS